MIGRRYWPVLLLLCAAVAAAEKLQTARAVAAKPTSPDADIERAIRERFARSKCAADQFTVRVQGGVATIEGRTNVIQRKGAATRMAKGAGARTVINKIEISAQAKEKASANLAKGRRRVQVRRGEPRNASGGDQVTHPTRR